MKFRLLCFASHLLVSFAIALLAMWCVFGVWYPSPLDVAMGVTDIFILLLCVDMIVGPLLTLLVAKQGKKTLKIDLAVIGVLQLIALGYGLYIVAQGRPVWLVYNNKRFDVIQAYEVIASSEELGSEFYLSHTGPLWAAVTPEAAVLGADASYRQDSLVAFNNLVSQAIVNANPIAILNSFNDHAKVDLVLKQYPLADGYIPMSAKNQSMVVLVSKSEQKVIAIVALAPW